MTRSVQLWVGCLAVIFGMGCATAQNVAVTEGSQYKQTRKLAHHSGQVAEQIGSVVSGFRLLEVRPVQEANAIARLYEHEKSGARLLYLSNDDDNKLFSIGFRTPSGNSTGVAHILEHSVLCGSEKFPTKEPFVELMKGSVNTFVNAMTYQDKTVYPVASRNDKDFVNLMDVYMDAVLHPNIYKNPYTLMQEGWRYELNEKTHQLEYNGVVYSEMKGALSAPDRLLGEHLQYALFPKHAYGVTSGGNPLQIPDLTAKAFVGFHKKYYHPSNSTIFLYGNGNVEEHLSFLDVNYLSHFERKKIRSAIPLAKPFKAPREVEDRYSINEGETTAGKTFMGMSFVVGRSTDPELFLAMDILQYILIETDSSPLKRALTEAGIGKSIEGYYDATLQQPVFVLTVKGTDPEKKEAFKNTVKQTLSHLVKNGIPKKLLEGALSRKEFLLREFEPAGQPKGLAYYDKVMDSWLYDGDPLVHLQYEPVLAKIKAQAFSGYFEGLIQKYLLSNQHRAVVVLKPEQGLDAKIAAEVSKKLAQFQSKLKPKELERIVRDTQELKRRQQTPDTAEALEKIPLLKISDINPKADELPIVVQSGGDGSYQLFGHSVFTNQIAHVGLYFDVSWADAVQLQKIALIRELLGKMNTQKYNFLDLSTELNTHTGDVSHTLGAFADKESLNDINPKFLVQSKVLLSKLPKLSELLKDILLGTQYQDAARLKEIIQEARSRMENSIQSSGHRFAVSRLGSYTSQAGKFKELTTGISFYQFLVHIEKDLDRDAAAVSTDLQELSRQVFSRSKLLVSFTAPEADFIAARAQLDTLAMQFPVLESRAKAQYALRVENEGFTIPSKVQFVAKGADYRQLGFGYSGHLLVANNLVSNDYLWNRVRVLGGAYGGWMLVGRQGTLAMASYRDPNLQETLDVYNQAGSYLKNVDLSPREVTKYILGSVSELDMPLSPASKGMTAMSNFLGRLSQADIQQERDEVLSTKLSDLKQLGDLLDRGTAQNIHVVIGNPEKIQSNSRLFGKIIQVLE